jgi:putative two-component system response regulator
LGAKTLDGVKLLYPKNYFIQMGIDIALYHHEKWDGSGYISGIAGENIPLSARIMAVADVYDALRFKRCYKAPISHIESLEIIRKGSGAEFDPEIVAVFCSKQNQIRMIYELLN